MNRNLYENKEKEDGIQDLAQGIENKSNSISFTDIENTLLLFS